jgi:hypothetical protein
MTEIKYRFFDKTNKKYHRVWSTFWANIDWLTGMIGFVAISLLGVFIISRYGITHIVEGLLICGAGLLFLSWKTTEQHENESHARSTILVDRLMRIEWKLDQFARKNKELTKQFEAQRIKELEENG